MLDPFCRVKWRIFFKVEEIRGGYFFLCAEVVTGCFFVVEESSCVFVCAKSVEQRGRREKRGRRGGRRRRSNSAKVGLVQC